MPDGERRVVWVNAGYYGPGRFYMLELFENGIKCAVYKAFPRYDHNDFKVYPLKILYRGYALPFEGIGYVDFRDVRNGAGSG